MEKLTTQQKWVCGIVFSLGIISAVLGIFAEMKRIKASQVTMVNGRCVYPSSPALVLGVLAALILLIAQVLVTVVGGCVCCRPAPPVVANSPAASNRSVAIICLVACWITFLNAFALLMAGASLNDQRQQQSMWFVGLCNVVKPLVFAGGSLLALATVVLDLIFYLASCAAKAPAGAAQVSPQQIAMGQAYPAYPAPYGSNDGNAQAYSYPYGPYPHPPQNQMQVPADPSAPSPPYPGLVTGYPKSPQSQAN